MAICHRCGENRAIVEPDSGATICGSCGVVLDHGSYDAPAFGADGRPEGFIVHSDLGYRDRKLYRAETLISDLTSRLGLSPAAAAEAAAMVRQLTDDELGDGDWFPVLVAACSYIATRRLRSPLSIAEAAAALRCDVHELGRMVSRVSRHLDLHQLPDFNSALALDRAIKNSPCFPELRKEKAEEMIGQGRFLLQCAMKWFIATGRQPLPIVAAITAFVAEANGVPVGVEPIARQIFAGVRTSKLRLKELREALIKVARLLLPWGEDVTAKNLGHNARLLIRMMGMKSRFNPASEVTEPLGFDMNELLGAYSDPNEDSKYFSQGKDEDVIGMSCHELESIKISKETLLQANSEMMGRLAQVKERGGLGNGDGGLGNGDGKKRRRGGFDFEAWKDSWRGVWDSDKELTFDEILKRDVGYDCLPPSFIAGVEAVKCRRRKIEAAKLRIDEIKKPPSVCDLGFERKEEHSPSKQLVGKKRRREGIENELVGKKRRREGIEDDCIDWEDCLIELLILRGVNEDEIEQGHYRRLLDLHIFNS